MNRQADTCNTFLQHTHKRMHASRPARMPQCNSKEGLTKRLVRGQVSLDDEHGCPDNQLLLKAVASPPVKAAVNLSNGHLRAL